MWTRMVRHGELARKGASALRVRSHGERGVDVVEVEGDPSAKKGGKGKGGRTNTNANETTC